MAQSIQAAGGLYPSDNASFVDSAKLDASTAGLSLLQNPKVLIGFTIVLMIVLANVFGKKKLPAGAKPLPMHPGELVQKIRGKECG